MVHVSQRAAAVRSAWQDIALDPVLINAVYNKHAQRQQVVVSAGAHQSPALVHTTPAPVLVIAQFSAAFPHQEEVEVVWQLSI